MADHIDKDTTSAIIRKRVTDVLIRNGIEIRDVFVVRGKAYPPESAKSVRIYFFKFLFSN